MTSWIQAGTSLAGQFPGFLGAGWVRPDTDRDSWQMLYRFADAEALERWESSDERAWWRDASVGLGVVESRVERRTGIEGWFDAPTSVDVEDLRPAPAAPPRWKQAVTIFLVFFPLSVVVNAGIPLVGLDRLPLVLRVLATILVMTPVMTYAALPWITKRMEWFLHGQPPPWRRARS